MLFKLNINVSNILCGTKTKIWAIVGGVSENGLCKQSWLIEISVKRHYLKENVTVSIFRINLKQNEG